MVSGSWALIGSSAAVALLAVPTDSLDLLTVTIVHLTLVVTSGLALTAVLTRTLDAAWFSTRGAFAQWLRTAIGLVALVTGFVAMLTLSSSAALRLDPSLQFLQLLSALDIAWVTAGTGLGVYWLAGRIPGIAAGALLAAMCIWSSWRYLSRVGFSPRGGWIVDGAALTSLVIPLDVLAAALTVAVLVLGARRRAGLHRS